MREGRTVPGADITMRLSFFGSMESDPSDARGFVQVYSLNKTKYIMLVVLCVCMALQCDVASSAESVRKVKIGAQMEIKESKNSFEMTLHYFLDKPAYVLSSTYTSFGYGELLNSKRHKGQETIIVVEFWPPAWAAPHSVRRWKDRKYVLVHNGDRLTYVLNKNQMCGALTLNRGVATLGGKFHLYFNQHYLSLEDYIRYQQENSTRDGYIRLGMLSKNFNTNQVEIQLRCDKPVTSPEPWDGGFDELK